MFEDINISFDKNEPGKIKPFISFSIDNNRGISSLFYCDNEEGHCDIIINCCYRKFLLK